jgi:hypothetical protein
MNPLIRREVGNTASLDMMMMVVVVVMVMMRNPWPIRN